MSETKHCNQKGCTNAGAYRFTWPGNDEAHICEEHAPKLRGIAAAMGLHVQLIPIERAPS
ncbi:MAG: hypothetical protein OEW52_00200 [Thermoleophilia bacterium]|nr:hypothetical protein [Thermoleophilia bacterium]